MALVDCPRCRHLVKAGAPCPTCRRGVKPGLAVGVLLGLAVVSPGCMVGQSLYGAPDLPPIEGKVGQDGPVDADQDTWPPPADCDDTNPDVHPGAPEIAGDGVDSDCDGRDDP